MMRRRAFTLIEVLAVVGVVGVLAAITVPALARARQRAQSVVCLSTLASLMQGHVNLSVQNGGYWANVFEDPAALWAYSELNTSGFLFYETLEQTRSWPYVIQRGMYDRGDDPRMFSCPAIRQRYPEYVARSPQGGGRQSYFYSAAFLTEASLWDPDHPERRETPDRYRRRVRTHEVRFPSAKVAMFEIADHHGSGVPIGDRSIANVNAGFADGHVDRVVPWSANPPLAVRPPRDPFEDPWTNPMPFSSAAWGYLGRDY